MESNRVLPREFELPVGAAAAGAFHGRLDLGRRRQWDPALAELDRHDGGRTSLDPDQFKSPPRLGLEVGSGFL